MLPHPASLCFLILFILLLLRWKHEALDTQSLQLIAQYNYQGLETHLWHMAYHVGVDRSSKSIISTWLSEVQAGSSFHIPK